MFSHVIGNEPIKVYLKKAIVNSRLAQTLLFSGPYGVGKRLAARAIAKELLQSENSPDLHVITPEGKSGLYAIETLREMIDQEHAASYAGKGHVFILEDVDRMQPACANILLKTLEEPREGTTFILLTSKLQELLPTIISRCQLVEFQPIAEKSIEAHLKEKGYATHFAKWAHGSIGRALELAQFPELEEQRKILFSLLENKPSYPERSLQLAKLEELLLGKEDNPLWVRRQIEYLLSAILMWNRDQKLHALGGDPKYLFFSDGNNVSGGFSDIEESVAKVVIGLDRNMSLGACLSYLIDTCVRSYINP